MWPLAALTVGVTILAAVGVLPTWPGLVHLVALPPLDLFTDLRILVVQAPSWPEAVALLAAAVTLRIVLVAYLLGGLSRANLGFVARLYALFAVPMLVAAISMSVAATLPNAPFFWFGFGVLAVVTVLGIGLPWQGTARLRSAIVSSVRTGLRLEVVALYLAAVIAIGVVAHLVPEMTLFLVPVSALATALALRGFAREPVRRPGLLVLGAVAVVAVGALVMWSIRTADIEAQEPPSQDGSMMLMGGITTASGEGMILEIEPDDLGYTCEQMYYFSYAGPGEGQPQRNAPCPIVTGAVYEEEDTQRPLNEQIDFFAEQTEDLPRPLVVAGHSHAVWVAWEAMARGLADVDVLILVGPLPDSPVGYPPPGENGAGRVLGDVIRLGATVPMTEYDPDLPGSQDLQGVPNRSRDILAEPLPDGVRVLSVMTAMDLPLMSEGWELDVERNACPLPVDHSDMPVTNEFTEEVIRFLDGQPRPECPVWRGWGSMLVLPFGSAPAPAGEEH